MGKTKRPVKVKRKSAPKKAKRPVRKAKPAARPKPKAKPKARSKPPKPRPSAPDLGPRLRSPIPVAWLFDEEGRERALDSLASWTVSTLQAAQHDDGAARETLKIAVETFYDIREAAKQPRGEYAGHFFIVDGVGLGESNRPVPWQVLAETVPQEQLTKLSAIFEEVEREAK